MSKNSSKPPAQRHHSDGAPVPTDLSPALLGGGGGGDTTADESLTFKLERVETALLKQLGVGFPIQFTDESKTDIAATHGGKVIGYVPRRHVARVKQMRLGPYSAEVQSLSHHSVEVRITA